MAKRKKPDKRVADVIRTLASELDTSDALVEDVLGHLLPSIRLVPQHPETGERDRVGGCRIGGAPDLPPGVDWPRLPTDSGSPPGEPLSFLLQVNLAEVASADREQLLPKSGILSFFFHLDEVGVEDVPAVLFVQGANLRRAPVPPDLPADQVYRSFNLVPRLEWTVPSPDDLGDLAGQHLELWDELEDQVAAVQGYESPTTWGPGHAIHRLLGHPQFIQAFGTGVGTRLLLQVSSDAGLSKDGYPESGIGASWHDCGRIYYLMGEEALKSHRFTEVFVNLECA
jgi:hypothetical protein